MAGRASYSQFGTLFVEGITRGDFGFSAYVKPHWDVDSKSLDMQLCKMLNDTIKNPYCNQKLASILNSIVSHVRAPGSSVPLYGEWENETCRVIVKIPGRSVFSDAGSVLVKLSDANVESDDLSIKDSMIRARGVIESELSNLAIANKIVIGRGTYPKALRYADGVSRSHVEIKKTSLGQYHVRDLDSTNGTFVFESMPGNGEAHFGSLSKGRWTRLEHGSVVTAGSTIRLGPKDAGTIFQLPTPEPVGCAARAKIVSALSDLRPGSSMRIGSSSDTLNLLNFPGVKPVHVEIFRDAIWSFRIVPENTYGVVYYSKDTTKWNVVTPDISLWAGYHLRLGEYSTGIELVLPLQLTTKLRTLSSGSKVLVGRSNHELYLDQYPALSREHAVIYIQEDGTYFVEDLNSTNGTYVVEPLRKPVRINGIRRVYPGTIVNFGGGEKGFWTTLPNIALGSKHIYSLNSNS